MNADTPKHARDDAPLEIGKLPSALLAEVLDPGRPPPPDLALPPTIGEDAGVIALPDGMLVAASDPVTLTGQDVGAHAVVVNANDIAVMGARPRWFSATVLLPCGTTPGDVRALFADMHDALHRLDIVLIGGHIEVTDVVRQPVVVGSMMGLATDGHYVRTAGLEPGDAVLQIGPAPVEGAAVLAAEAAARLAGRVPAPLLDAARGALATPGISVVDAALRATALGASTMHDPTEGGLSAGLHEMADASAIGLVVDEAAVLWFEPGRALADALGIDAWGLLASGALLAGFPETRADEALAALKADGFAAARIATADAAPGVRFTDGRALTRHIRDEVIRVLRDEA